MSRFSLWNDDARKAEKEGGSSRLSDGQRRKAAWDRADAQHRRMLLKGDSRIGKRKKKN